MASGTRLPGRHNAYGSLAREEGSAYQSLLHNVDDDSVLSESGPSPLFSAVVLAIIAAVGLLAMVSVGLSVANSSHTEQLAHAASPTNLKKYMSGEVSHTVNEPGPNSCGWTLIKQTRLTDKVIDDTAFLTDYILDLREQEEIDGCASSKKLASDIGGFSVHLVKSVITAQGPLPSTYWLTRVREMRGGEGIDGRYDAFMDDNTVFYTADLTAHAARFYTDGINMRARSWSGTLAVRGDRLKNVTWYSIKTETPSGRLIQIVSNKIHPETPVEFKDPASDELPASHEITFLQAAGTTQSWFSTWERYTTTVSTLRAGGLPQLMPIRADIPATKEAIDAIRLYLEKPHHVFSGSMAYDTDATSGGAWLTLQGLDGVQLRYIYNPLATAGDVLEEFTAYTRIMHENYMSSTLDQAKQGWDHFMDNHWAVLLNDNCSETFMNDFVQTSVDLGDRIHTHKQVQQYDSIRVSAPGLFGVEYNGHFQTGGLYNHLTSFDWCTWDTEPSQNSPQDSAPPPPLTSWIWPMEIYDNRVQDAWPVREPQ